MHEKHACKTCDAKSATDSKLWNMLSLSPSACANSGSCTEAGEESCLAVRTVGLRPGSQNSTSPTNLSTVALAKPEEWKIRAGMCHEKAIPSSPLSQAPHPYFCLLVGHVQLDDPQAPETQHVQNNTSAPLSLPASFSSSLCV